MRTVPIAWVAVLLAAALPHRGPGAQSPVDDLRARQREAAQPQQPLARTTVGMRGIVTGIALPGPRLQARPMDDPGRDPLLLEILAAEPLGGGGDRWSYELAYTAFVPGRHDLAEFFVDAAGEPVTGLRQLPVEVTAVLPPGPAEPLPLNPNPSTWPGGYEAALWVGGVVWVLGLLAGLFAFRRRNRNEDAGHAPTGPTLADRLRPLVEGAMAGTLSNPKQAELERLLLDHWRQRLGLMDEEPVRALQAMRRHEESGELLQALERWLHRPPPADGGAAVDPAQIQRLLAPYKSAADPAPGARP